MHPIVQKLVLSHEKSLTPMRDHPICLIPSLQKNQLFVQALLCLPARDVHPAEIATIALVSHVVASLTLSRVAPSAHATPSLILPFSSYPSTFT